MKLQSDRAEILARLLYRNRCAAFVLDCLGYHPLSTPEMHAVSQSPSHRKHYSMASIQHAVLLLRAAEVICWTGKYARFRHGSAKIWRKCR